MASAAVASFEQEEEDVCRYCRQRGTPQNPLFYPCKCSGSLKYVHETCLRTWQLTSNSTKCEVCKYNIKFEKVWQENTPNNLPITEIIHGLWKNLQNGIALGFHRGLVGLMWLLLLPLAVSYMKSSAFPDDIHTETYQPNNDYIINRVYNGIVHIFQIVYNIFALNINFNDWLQGVWLIAINVVVILAMLYLREQMINVLEKNVRDQRQAVINEMRNLITQRQKQRLMIEKQIDRSRSQQEKIEERKKELIAQLMELKRQQEEKRKKYQAAINRAQQLQATQRDDQFSASDSENFPGQSSSRKMPEEEPDENLDQKDQDQTQDQIKIKSSKPDDSDWSDISDSSEDKARDSTSKVTKSDQYLDEKEIDNNLKKIAELADNSELTDSDEDHEAPDENQPVRDRDENNAGNDDGENLDAILPRANIAIDNITWQRVVGLDGTFNFLEYVLYAFILNAIFIWMFWYFPMWLGRSCLSNLPILNQFFGYKKTPYFILPIATLFYIFVGYCFIMAGFGVMARFKKMIYIRKRMRLFYKFSSISNSIYLCQKAGILMLLELFIYPTMIGIWLDLCTIGLIGFSLEARINIYRVHPIWMLIAHLACGMMTIWKFVNSILLVRTKTREGLIWFIRNMDDQDYSPLKDMIESPFLTHIKRFIYTCTLLGWVVIVAVWIPTKIGSSLGIVNLPFYEMNSPKMRQMAETARELKADLDELNNGTRMVFEGPTEVENVTISAIESSQKIQLPTEDENPWWNQDYLQFCESRNDLHEIYDIYLQQTYEPYPEYQQITLFSIGQFKRSDFLAKKIFSDKTQEKHLKPRGVLYEFYTSSVRKQLEQFKQEYRDRERAKKIKEKAQEDFVTEAAKMVFQLFKNILAYNILSPFMSTYDVSPEFKRNCVELLGRVLNR